MGLGIVTKKRKNLLFLKKKKQKDFFLLGESPLRAGAGA
jgi:hypothetical protein